MNYCSQEDIHLRIAVSCGEDMCIRFLFEISFPLGELTKHYSRPNVQSYHIWIKVLILNFLARMHSSRMRTIRCSSRLLGGMSTRGGGCLPRGGLCLPGVCVCLPRGACLPGGCLADTPVDRMTDRCKTLPCRNYVVDGNYASASVSHLVASERYHCNLPIRLVLIIYRTSSAPVATS